MPDITEIELPEGSWPNRILSIAQAAKLRGVSPDTIRRHYPHLIRKLSPRRLGLSVTDALKIGETIIEEG
jgi:hypothetical protein